MTFEELIISIINVGHETLLLLGKNSMFEASTSIILEYTTYKDNITVNKILTAMIDRPPLDAMEELKNSDAECMIHALIANEEFGLK